MDILIKASKDRVSHKFEENMLKEYGTLEDVYCWWTINGKPKQTYPGDKIMFSDGNHVYAEGTILSLEPGRINFTPLKQVQYSNPKKPPMRGFTYVK